MSISNYEKYEKGQRIRKLRERFNETQDDIGELLGVKRQQISFFENGERKPKLEQIVILAKHFNCSTDYLLGVTEVDTNDKDKQFVCDYLNLSQQTIEKLKVLSQVSDRNNTVINDFLSSDCFHEFVYLLRNLLEYDEHIMEVLSVCFVDKDYIKSKRSYIPKDLNCDKNDEIFLCDLLSDEYFSRMVKYTKDAEDKIDIETFKFIHLLYSYLEKVPATIYDLKNVSVDYSKLLRRIVSQTSMDYESFGDKSIHYKDTKDEMILDSIYNAYEWVDDEILNKFKEIYNNKKNK